MQKAWAIGLYSYSIKNQEELYFQKFYDLVLKIYQDIGIKPTYFAADGAGYKGDLTKFGGRTHLRAVKSGFSDIHVMSIVANPEGSKEAGYDSFASASLAYVKETDEILLSLMIEEQYLEYGRIVSEVLLNELVKMCPWDFGYALCEAIEKKPEFHVLGIDSGKLNREEQRRLNAWYDSPPKERILKLRDIYPIVILNHSQLSNRLSDSRTLEEFIRTEPNSILTRFEDSCLWLWNIEASAISNIREFLSGSDILIT